MKFGQNLPRNQVPEWASAYINYKGLKKLIKAANQQSTATGGEVDLAGGRLKHLTLKACLTHLSRVLLRAGSQP